MKTVNLHYLVCKRMLTSTMQSDKMHVRKS